MVDIIYNNDDRSEEYREKPLYYFDLDEKKSEPAILEWVRAQHKVSKRDELPFFENMEENLAVYLGRGKAMKSVLRPTTNGQLTPVRPGRRKFVRLKVHRLKSVIEILAAKYLSNKTSFFVTPRHVDDFSKEAKAKTAERVIETVFQERNIEHVKRKMVNDALILGEGYVRVFWDDQLGPVKSTKKVKVDIPEGSEEGVQEEASVSTRLGDVNVEALDPRFIIVQPKDSFRQAEWVIQIRYEMEETLKLQYPDKQDMIEKAEVTDEYLNTTSLCVEKPRGKVRVYRLWHRPTGELPNGRYIECTDTVILENHDIKEKSIVENKLFPIVQLTDTDIYGSPRGRANSVMEPGKELQLAIHNLWSILIRNLLKFPPMRIWPAEVDKKILEKGVANDVFLNSRTSVNPQLLYADPVSASLVNSIQELDSKLLQLAQINPALRGQGMSNTEVRSGTMLQVFQEEDNAAMLPMNDKINEAMLEIAHLVLAVAKDNYKDGEGRLIKLFGKRSRFLKKEFSVEELNSPVDIRILRQSAFAGTRAGKIAEIESIMALFPSDPASGQKPLLSRERVLDILEEGEPDAFYDDVTGIIDTAKKEIGDILEGRDVSPPTAQMELLPYYEAYIKAMQHPRIKDEIPQEDEFIANPDKNKPGYRMLRQTEEIEMILWEKAQDNPLLKEELMIKFPLFPTIYKPELTTSLNPFEAAQDQAIPLSPEELLPPGQEGEEPLPPVQ
jgi:hypothetical protein